MKNLMKSVVLSILFITCFNVNVFADNKTVTAEVNISQDIDGTILITCEDDTWSALVAESGTIDFCARIYGTETDIVEHTVEAKDIAYSDNVLSISKEYVSNNIYPCIYNVVIKIDGYSNVEPTLSKPLEVNIGKTKIATPSYTVAENDDGKIEISCSDTDFLNDVWRVFIVSDGNESQMFTYDQFEISGNTLTFDISSANFVNGEYQCRVQNIAYEDLLVPNQLTLSHQKTKACPEFSYEFNVNGDLVVSSSDADWINGLAVEREWNDDAIKGTARIDDVDYMFGSHNSSFETIKAFEIIEDKAIFDVESQLNTFRGQTINGIEFDVVFSSSGYTRSNAKKITFTHAMKHIPNDTKVELTGNYLFVKSSNTDFINNIRIINIYNSSKEKLLSSIDDNMQIETKDDNAACYKITNNEIKSALVAGNKIAFWTHNNDYVSASGVGGETDWKTLEVKGYSITFLNGEHGSGTMDLVQAGGSYRLPSNEFIAESGYEFSGWKIDDTNKIYFVNEKVFINDNTVLTALWKQIPTPTTTVEDADIVANTVISVDSSQANVMGAKLDDDNLSSLLSPTDVASGAAVWMETSTIDIEDNNYKQLNRALSLESKGQLLKCLEINVFKQVKGQSATKVSETYAKAKISLDLSDDEELMEKAINGELYVYNIHDGKISDLITGTYNPTTHIFTFEADEFSTYGLVFVENTTPVPTPTPKPKKKIKYVSPSTGVE